MFKRMIEFFEKNIYVVTIVAILSLVSNIITVVCGWADFYNDFLVKQVSVSVLGILLISLLILLVFVVVLDKNSQGSKKNPEIMSFHASYRDTDWKGLFDRAQNSITICSFYLDSFLGWTDKDIEKFLKKDNVKLTVIVSDYKDAENIKRITRLFPQYSEAVVKNKIIGTKTKIKDILNKIKITDEKFDFYVYSHLLNYSYILIDERYLYLSVYEMERGIKKDSPAMIFDLEKSAKLKEFIMKENSEVLKHSKKD